MFEVALSLFLLFLHFPGRTAPDENFYKRSTFVLSMEVKKEQLHVRHLENREKVVLSSHICCFSFSSYLIHFFYTFSAMMMGCLKWV